MHKMSGKKQTVQPAQMVQVFRYGGADKVGGLQHGVEGAKQFIQGIHPGTKIKYQGNIGTGIDVSVNKTLLYTIYEVREV
jgi:hypothetical protein